MIVPMKKAVVIVQAKDADDALENLRSLGLLHIEHQQPPKGSGINSLLDDLALISQAINILSAVEYLKSSASKSNKELPDWKFTSQHIIDSQKRLQRLDEYSRAVKNNISQWETWGDFNPERLEDLAAKNVYVRLYSVPLKQVKDFPSGVIVKRISTLRGIANCAVISGEKTEIPFKEVVLPNMSLKEMRARLAEDSRMTDLIKEDIRQHSCFRQDFLRIKETLGNQLEFCEALKGMGVEGEIMYLAGYVPYDKTEQLQITARKERWGIVVKDPADEDTVPTLIRNPRWVSLISPVFKLLGVIPGYRELDVSPLFLFFLSLFFGMIIGDAGYGIVYFLLALWLRKRLAKRIKDTRIFSLIYIFSACAIFWGVLTGTFFGQEWYLKAGLKPLIPVFNDTKFLQAFCFFLGAFHLTLAHLWQAIRKIPSLTAFADVGWVAVLWAAFFLAKTLILNDPFPFFGKPLIIAGISLVILCSSPQRNVFKMIGKGLATVALSLMNNFTDVVSYVRLFAVGLAGVAIADTVNTLAAGFGGRNPLAGVLIVFIGHTINIVLGPLSVLVHGIRLNVLEFSSHASLTWSGVAYKPLKGQEIPRALN
jgi:V/A-type H+-transporting ATPase subunit I